MAKWMYAGVLSAAALTWAGLRPAGASSDWAPHELHRRQEVANGPPAANSNVPDYVLVSPDFVALGPSSSGGLSQNGINNMMCLTNRRRYDAGVAPLALDAQLVRYAQARAEYLSGKKVKIQNNAIVGDSEPVLFNDTYWVDVKENVLQTTNNPTFAFWELQSTKPAEANMVGDKYRFFGVGLSGQYYVQAFGAPKADTMDPALFQWCPSNETYSSWVFPKGTPDPRAKQPNIVNTAFPYQDFAGLKPKYDADNDAVDNGRVPGQYYFSPPEGDVPFLKDLSIVDAVGASDSKTPFAAIADAGEQGLTKEELNLAVCLINARRYASCLPPVALHSQLIAAAQSHSYEMNRARNLSHYGSSGPMGMRIKRRGFSFSTIGENVAQGVHDMYSAFVGFAESQMHLDNILNPDFTFIGSGRSGQFWTITFGAYLNKTATPDLASLPLCPGNKTDIAIAFPSGVPAAPKLQSKACGGTKATSVTPPPYIQTHTGGEIQDTPTPTPTPTPTSSDDDSNGPSTSTTTTTSTTSTTTTVKRTRSSSTTTTTSTGGPVNVVVVTQVVTRTSYVDGDALMTSWENVCRAGGSPSPTTTTTTQSDVAYEVSSIDGSDFDIILEPHKARV
ncbi:hypothetical protein H4R18_003550 [Coemansia javaensis]|uniref:SCP domain-containing protein n=1 Tax=Coemansia javaensis TaxID=2761396 RepID=A0A9W8HBU2_9FUNG|nr:hypothetical protein H4R18_003550 [Coemansia javaensis]